MTTEVLKRSMPASSETDPACSQMPASRAASRIARDDRAVERLRLGTCGLEVEGADVPQLGQHRELDPVERAHQPRGTRDPRLRRLGVRHVELDQRHPGHAPILPSCSPIEARSTSRCTLPIALRGSASTATQRRGRLYAASRSSTSAHELRLELVETAAQHDVGHDRLAPGRVRQPDDRDVDDVFVLADHVLDLARDRRCSRR